MEKRVVKLEKENKYLKKITCEYLYKTYRIRDDDLEKMLKKLKKKNAVDGGIYLDKEAVKKLAKNNLTQTDIAFFIGKEDD